MSRSQGWLDLIGTIVTDGLNEMLDKGKGAPVCKKIKGAKGASHAETGISDSGADWIRQTCNSSIQASSAAFATAIDARFSPLEEQIASHDTALTTQQGEIDELK